MYVYSTDYVEIMLHKIIYVTSLSVFCCCNFVYLYVYVLYVCCEI